MIDLIVSDLDETFLLPDKSLSEVAEAALSKLDTLGMYFVPTTGRSIAAVPEAILAHSCARYAIGSNGAAIIDREQDKLIYERVIPKDKVLELAALLRYEDCSFDLFDAKGAKTSAARYDQLSFYGIDEHSLLAVLAARERVETTDVELIESMAAIEKITIYAKDEKTRATIYQAAESVGGLNATTSHPKNVELMSAHTSKGLALVHLAARLGIALSNVLAFGDSANDISMLCAAGHGIAVENARPEVLAVADAVCASNSESGPAHFILDALKHGL